MLIPLTRKTFESLIPVVATGPQYLYFWGKLPDLLRRLLISIVGVLIATLGIGLVFGADYGFLRFAFGVGSGFYWLWGPVLWASLKNLEYRRVPYAGFWQGEVLDVYITDELIGQEETVNNRGDLVIVENRERCINLEVGDEAGFTARLRVPLKRSHQAIDVGDTAQMVVMSNRGDLGRITKNTDIYIPNHNLWVNDYPYLQRDAFIEVSRQLRSRERRQPDDRSPGRSNRSERRERSSRNDQSPSPRRPPEVTDDYQSDREWNQAPRRRSDRSPSRRPNQRRSRSDW